ncbi:putative porin [Pelosinus baikalensis]|uniref:Porin n=1 Tax=Pelosinus baikalensis TaxID=2892015 RepID=A0ABS8HXY8_9FIRM|nr:putative porin [Pelosinus baikalensis]MCC5468033.1 putative porin [Pelosinus baikalensis]
MNKKIAFTLGTVFSLSVASTVLAAPANLFAVIPEHHWSYSAIGDLAKAGLVNGFGGGTYHEDVILTRCEMAAIVAKAMAKSDKADAAGKATIEKLKAEFSPELNMTMGNDTKVDSRLEKLEKNKSTIKMTGDARIRYQTNWNQGAKNTDNKNTTRMQERVRLNLTSDIAENLTLFGRLNATNDSNKYGLVSDTSKASKSGNPTFDRAELQWKNKQMTYSFGRFLPSLGQGIIWDYNSIDGAMATYDFGGVQFSSGYGDLAAYTASGKTTNAFIANLKVNVAQNANITIGHLNAMTNAVAGGYNFEQTAYGFNAKTGDFTVNGEYVKNDDNKLPTNAQDHGYWGRVL